MTTINGKKANPEFVVTQQDVLVSSQTAGVVLESIAFLSRAPIEELEYFVWVSKESGAAAKETDPFGAGAQLDINGHWERVELIEAFLRFMEETKDAREELEAVATRRSLLAGTPGDIG